MNFDAQNPQKRFLKSHLLIKTCKNVMKCAVSACTIYILTWLLACFQPVATCLSLHHSAAVTLSLPVFSPVSGLPVFFHLAFLCIWRHCFSNNTSHGFLPAFVAAAVFKQVLDAIWPVSIVCVVRWYQFSCVCERNIDQKKEWDLAQCVQGKEDSCVLLSLWWSDRKVSDFFKVSCEHK